MISAEKERQRAKSDAKLLFAVASLVVLGAVALALTAGQGARRARATEPANKPPVARRAVQPPLDAVATPAVFERASPVPVATAEGDDPIAEILIEPGEDLVAGGLAAYRERDFRRAAEYFAAESDARPERAWPHYMAALSLWKSGSPVEAAVAMEQAVRLDPESLRGWINLSRIENDRGEFEAALVAARRALALDPDEPSALFLEGRSSMNLGELEAAEASLRRSIELAPDNGYVHNMLGLLYLRHEMPNEAMAPLQRAVELEAEVAFIHNNLGMAFELTGRPDDAVAAYRAALELDPQHGPSVANVARWDSPETTPAVLTAGSAVPETPAAEVVAVEPVLVAKTEAGEALVAEGASEE